MNFAKLGLAVFSGLALMTTVAFAEGDADKGEKVFKKCKACHKIGEGAKNATGPLLNDLIGRTAGTAADYKYSASMVAAGEAGLVWNQENVAQFIEDPKAFLQDYLDDSAAKSKMSLKLKKEDDRENVAAYVATFSAAPAAEETDGEEEASD